MMHKVILIIDKCYRAFEAEQPIHLAIHQPKANLYPFEDSENLHFKNEKLVAKIITRLNIP